jgi:hypothetical protein
LRRYYLYAFLNGLQFTWTTWLAFVLAHGGNPGWAEGAYHMAILISEIPTGIVADLMGRRASMIVGLILSAIGPLGYFFIHDTLTACLVLGFSGFAGTFLSGADMALTYETALEAGGTEFARKTMARCMALNMAAQAIGPAIAGFLYQWQPISPFLGKTLVTLITLAVVLGMKENRGDHAVAGRNTVWQQTVAAVQVLRTNRIAFTFILFGWVYNLATAMSGQYGQAFFPHTGLAMGAVGLIYAGGQVLSTGGSTLSERLSAGAASRWLRFGPAAIAVAFLGMGLVGRGAIPLTGLVAGALFMLSSGTDGVVYPIWQARFNEVIPSAQRATIWSISSAGFSLLMTASFPAASYLPTIPLIYVVTGSVSVALAVIWMALRRPY